MRLHWLRSAITCAGFAFGLSASVAAHDWYPMECCHGMDCAPVLRVQFLAPVRSDAAPAMIVTTRHGTVMVPAAFPRRESKDNQMHACMRQGATGRMHLLCLFFPP